MKTLYFTATGNSLYIAKSIGGELLSIPKMVKEGRYEFSDEKIGIVFPLYAYSVPTFVADFLKKATFNCDYLFAVTTYGIFSAGIAKHLTDIADESGYEFSYINKIKMVDNFLPGFDMKSQMENESKKQIEKYLQIIKSDIEDSKKWIMKTSNWRKKATDFMVKRANKPSKKADVGIKNKITVDDTCTQCGICTSVCPVDNIELDKKTGKIVLSDNCFMCYACIQNCPSKAIHLKGERSGNRFRNSHVTLKEIIQANN